MLKNEFKLASLIKKGFTRHKDLNPQIFDENKKLRKEVRSKLLVIVNDFIECRSYRFRRHFISW